MELDAKRCSLVMVGAWNAAIFTPSWVGEVVFRGATPKLELGFGTSLAMRFVGDEFSLLVTPTQVQLTPVACARSSLASVGVAARSLFTRLPETPLSAVGINIGFESVAPIAAISSLLTFSDTSGLDKATLQAVTLARRLVIGDRIVNLSLGYTEGGPQHVDFNFHSQVATAGAAIAFVEGDLLAQLDMALETIRRLYGVDVEVH